MCKYCEFMTVNEKSGEKSAYRQITQVKDGHQIFALYLNRYIVEKDNVHDADLIVEIAAELRDGMYTIKEEVIPIKYCPFCGEEL